MTDRGYFTQHVVTVIPNITCHLLGLYHNYFVLNTTTLRPFYGTLDFVRDNLGEPVLGTFCHPLDFLVQNEDNTGRCTNNPDGLPPHPD